VSSSVCRAVAVPHCGTSPQPVRGVTGMRGARCSRVLTEFHMTPSPLSVAARPRCSPAFALLLRPDSRGTMLDLCYSEKCIATMGAENNWDDCGLDDTCGACPARFCMRPCCAHRCHGSTSPHASLGYLPERQSRAPPRGGAARLCRGYSAAAPRPRHLHRARTRVYPMGCAYTPSSPAVAEYCSAAQRIGTWLPSSNGCGEQFFS